MKVWVVEGDFVIYNSHVARNCIVYMVTLGELLRNEWIDATTILFLRRFFAALKILVPDHPDLDNVEFYIVYEKTHGYKDYVNIYVVFHHMEHSSVYDLQSFIVLMQYLMIVFDIDEVHLQEFNANGEYMVWWIPTRNPRVPLTIVYEVERHVPRMYVKSLRIGHTM